MVISGHDRSLLASLSIAVVVIVGVLALIFLSKFLALSTETRSRASVGDKRPITGTFIMHDSNVDGEADLKTVYDEMQELGIDTVVFLASGLLQTPCTPQPPSFHETYYFGDQYRWYINSLKQAKAHNMTVYFGLVNSDMHFCTPFWVGSENDTNTYMGRILDYSARLVDQVKQTVTSQGWNWNDSQFAGFYLFEGGVGNFVDPNSADIRFYAKLASRIKAKAPGKKLLISPWVTDAYTYDMARRAYVNLYNAGVDVIAPQDSMGSLKVTTYAKSAELFRALSDARNTVQGTKEAWANIETQLQPSAADANYQPSTVTRISAQITAAKPYVSKMITWIYQHTMLSYSAYDNTASWINQYTPARAQARKTLRAEYMAQYVSSPSPTVATCLARYYCNTQSYSCVATAATYDGSNRQCDNPAAICETNLATYLPGITGGTCFTSLSACQSACEAFRPTSTPMPMATPTSSPAPTPVLSPTTAPALNPADIDGNGSVNIVDYTLFMSGWWLKNFVTADLNNDGKISVIDYTIFMNGWNDYLHRNN